MKARLWLSVAGAAIGAGLLVSSGFAGSAAKTPQAPGKGEARGGTLRVDSRNDFDFVDPSLAYFAHSWQMQNAVQLKLMSFPDSEGAAGNRMRPEAATGFPKVSKDGKTYTFRIKQGFRFSNGSAVTAANFAAAIRRGLNPRMQSPASSFLDDVASFRTVGRYQLVVRMKKVAPDFIARMTMPFFAAIPTNLAIIPEGVAAPLVSAGPYYLKEWVQKRSAVLVRNPYWKAGQQPWKSLGRPANVNQINYTFGNSLDATKLRLERGEVDLGSIPPAAASELSEKYGINKGRFFIRKNLTTWYLALNNERPLWRGNVKLRQATNWAIDRPALVRQYGFLGGARTDQILPPGMPGFKDWNIYPLRGVSQSTLTKARGLARGNTREGKAILYTFNSAPGPALAQVVQFNLKQIGLDVEIRTFDRTVQNAKSGTRGEPFDISIEGWGADYPDPYNFINVLLDGRRIQADNNVNLSYFNNAAYNRRIESASRLFGDARLNAYAKLEQDIMKNQAPIAPYINTNAKILVSSRIGCYTYSVTTGSSNLVAVCLK